MEYVVLKTFQEPGYAALEVGEVARLPCGAERIAELVADGYIAPVAVEIVQQGPAVVEPGDVAEMKPHYVGQGEPTPGTWEAEWRQGTEAPKKGRKAPSEE